MGWASTGANVMHQLAMALGVGFLLRKRQQGASLARAARGLNRTADDGREHHARGFYSTSIRREVSSAHATTMGFFGASSTGPRQRCWIDAKTRSKDHMGWFLHNSVRNLYNTCSSPCKYCKAEDCSCMLPVCGLDFTLFIVYYKCGAEHLCVYQGVFSPSLLLYFF